MSTDISVAGHAMTPAMKAIPTDGHNGSGNGAPVADAIAPAAESAPSASPWTPADSARTYGIDYWGQGYFSITPEGTVAVHPDKNKDRKIESSKQSLRKRNALKKSSAVCPR